MFSALTMDIFNYIHNPWTRVLETYIDCHIELMKGIYKKKNMVLFISRMHICLCKTSTSRDK